MVSPLGHQEGGMTWCPLGSSRGRVNVVSPLGHQGGGLLKGFAYAGMMEGVGMTDVSV